MKDIAVLLNARPEGIRIFAGWLMLARVVRGTAAKEICGKNFRGGASRVDKRRNGVKDEAKTARRPPCATSTNRSGGSSR